MSKDSRIENSIMNAKIGLITQVVTIGLGFINRSVFIYFLSIEYLGINGVFSNLLTMLSLAELGVGSSMTYSLYKPLANRDEDLLQGLMQIYSRVYKIIALVIGIVGIILIPCLPYIIKTETSISNINIIYILYLTNTVISYLFSYKRTIISADQKEYINSKYRYKFNLLKSILQMIFLWLTKNFIAYLVIQIICTLLENIIISSEANKMYPFLKNKNKVKLEESTIKELITNTKATMIYKISGVMLDGTDNLIISSIIGVKWVGLIANYTLLISSVSTVVNIVTNSVSASLGNFIVKENKYRQEELFYILMFISFWVYGFCSSCLFVLVNPFIELWLGEAFLLNKLILSSLVLNFYIVGMQSTVWMYRSAMGLFIYGKWRPVISAILNIIISILLASKIGLLGVLLGTAISRIVTNVWHDPIIIFKHGFKKRTYEYYFKYIKYLIIIIFTILIINNISNKFLVSNFSTFLTLMVICIIIPNVIFFCTFYNTKEFKYVLSIIKDKIKNIFVYNMN